MKIFTSCIYPYLILVAFSLGLTVNAEKKDAKLGPLTPIVEVEGLPNVLIIGDSISIGYTLPTRALLQGKVNLHRIPTNGGPTTKGLSDIDKWLSLIHI